MASGRLGSRTNDLTSRHPGLPSSVELFCDIRQEHHRCRRLRDRCEDLAISGRLTLRAYGRVEVVRQQRRQVAELGMAEEQLLRFDGAGRIDAEGAAFLLPTSQARRYFIVDLGG